MKGFHPKRQVFSYMKESSGKKRVSSLTFLIAALFILQTYRELSEAGAAHTEEA